MLPNLTDSISCDAVTVNIIVKLSRSEEENS